MSTGKIRVSVLVHDGFEETELIAPVDLFRRASFDVRIISMTGSKTVTGSHGIALAADHVWTDERDALECDCVFLPGGGKNSESLRDDRRVTELLKKADRSGKLIAAICAAPRALERAGIIDGRKITAYPGSMPDGKYIYVSDAVVVDGNIVTGMGAGVAVEFGLTALGLLTDAGQAKKLADNITLYTYRWPE